MGEKIVVGPINKGFRNDVRPFNVDNDSFPTLINAYQWRGRVKRKRGTSFLTRLQRFFNSNSTVYNPGSLTITLSGFGAGNILTGFTTLETNASIVPGSVTITVGVNVYTDPSEDGTLSPSGTINYATGAIVILAEANNNATATFLYYPTLPVMGIEDFYLFTNANIQNISFDTKYSYAVSISEPYSSRDVSFFKNLPTGTYTNYVQKTNYTRLTWNGGNYQQFWTVNYEGALWATNGINVPFSASNIGMPGVGLTNIVINVAGPPARATITTSANHGLSIGDFVFINEVDEAVVTGINLQTGYVTAVPALNQITVDFLEATLGGAAGLTSGFVQFLTSRSNTTKDCLRYYDGDPTNGSATAPVLNGTKGWVNFCPPLSQTQIPIVDLPSGQYYLVGARLIVPFKDRLIFMGVVVQTSSGNPIYLQDTIVYSQNGTPYYTCSFTGDPVAANIEFTPILTPSNNATTSQTATATSFFASPFGFGGFIAAGVDEPIISCQSNLDVLIIGFPSMQMKLVYTGNDVVPFNFYFISTELGTSSTFGAVNLGSSVVSRGDRGFIGTTQNNASRIDLEIPDEVFQTNLGNNGAERVCAQRDFINEWIYFTYRDPDDDDSVTSFFPNKTLQYNYRDNSWALFYESYTTYGFFRKQTGFIWSTVGEIFPTWEEWNEPWNAGSNTLLQINVVGGNQQGYLITRDQGTAESKSLAIKNISGNTVTSPDHALNAGDYIVIYDCLGTVSSQVNGKVFRVSSPDSNTFELDPAISAGTYLGLGQIKRMYVPFIQTRQFPVAWGMGRKTRLGPQQYLFTTTDDAQIQLLIFLSQNGSSPYNNSPIVPDPLSTNPALIYSSVLYTCPEGSNLGLTPFNYNLNMPTAVQQSEIWHRMNTSLIGDTVQIGFTLSDAQMRDEDLNFQFAEIELHGFILDVSPSQLLA